METAVILGCKSKNCESPPAYFSVWPHHASLGVKQRLLAVFDREALAWPTSRTDRNKNEPKELVRCFWNGNCQDLGWMKTEKVTKEAERARDLIYTQVVEVNERKNMMVSAVIYLIPGWMESLEKKSD
jgi:hypothetical protein